jgi:hypothetical protein
MFQDNVRLSSYVLSSPPSGKHYSPAVFFRDAQNCAYRNVEVVFSSVQPKINLRFMVPCIVIIFYYINSNKMHMLQSLSDNCSKCIGRHYHPYSGARNNCNYSIWQPIHCIVVCCYRGRVGTGLSVLWVA